MSSALSCSLVGLFVGGRGERMGGVAKGLLTAPTAGQSLLERTLSELAAALPNAEVVLVGEAQPYAHFGVPAVADAPSGIGPLGGVLGLLEFAERERHERVLVLPCDLPYVERRVLGRLASEASSSLALVAFAAGVRNPLVARYTVAPTLSAARAVQSSGKRSLQALLDALGPGLELLELDATEAASLDDWDTPADLERRRI